MNAKLTAELELTQRKTSPLGILGYFHIRNMNITVKQMTFIERTLMSVNLCLDITGTEV